jgi:hypothetical protein
VNTTQSAGWSPMPIDDCTAPTHSVHDALRNISYGVVIFLLWTFQSFNWNFNVYAGVWLCFYPLTTQRTILRALH